MDAIFQREFKSYFHSVTGYLFIAFILLFAGIYTMAFNLSYAYANFEYVLSSMRFIFLIAVPILTMRSIAEEKRQKTDQLLYALPIGIPKVVMGKYFSMLAIFGISLGIIGFYPLILTAYGTVNLLIAYGSLLGFFFMGASLIAIGFFISSVTENQAIAAVLTFGVLLLVYFIKSLATFIPDTAGASFLGFTLLIVALCIITLLMTKNGFVTLVLFVLLEGALLLTWILSAASLNGLFPSVLEGIALFSRFDTFSGGMFDITALVAYVAVTAVMLFFTVQSLEKRRWS